MKEIDSDVVIKHLKNKWGEQKTCPMCNTGEWEVVDLLFHLSAFSKPGGKGRTISMPLVPVCCGNCGYTVLLNALQADLTEVPEGFKVGRTLEDLEAKTE